MAAVDFVLCRSWWHVQTQRKRCRHTRRYCNDNKTFNGFIFVLLFFTFVVYRWKIKSISNILFSKGWFQRRRKVFEDIRKPPFAKGCGFVNRIQVRGGFLVWKLWMISENAGKSSLNISKSLFLEHGVGYHCQIMKRFLYYHTY